MVKDSNLFILISSEDKERLKKAAHAENRSVANYVLTAAFEKLNGGVADGTNEGKNPTK